MNTVSERKLDTRKTLEMDLRETIDDLAVPSTVGSLDEYERICLDRMRYGTLIDVPPYK